ncbi:MAG: NAD-dependent epimerase/dehydratase family protein [Cytophagales bacterium]|nr:NAD-dependent epimerase/dehydratase family protein [Cytophagales bacterium]
MKIIVTGAAGFIGSNLSKRLLNEGHEVVGIDNFSFGNPENISRLITNPRFSFHERDLLDESTLEEHAGDSLVHLASHKIPRYSTAWKTLDDNSKMVSKAIQHSLRNNMHLLLASTSDVYGKNPQVPYHEESDLLLGPTTVKRWAYAISKIYSEQLIQAAHQEFGLTYTIMRFFGSYGPNQNRTWWGGPQAVFIQNVLEGKPLEVHGDGEQTRTFTFVEDTVDGIYRCITNERARNDIFNIAGNPAEEITIQQLAELIVELIKGKGTTPDIRLVPYATFGKYEDVRRRVPVIDKIVQHLDYRPTHNLLEGLKKTIEWQKALV